MLATESFVASGSLLPQRFGRVGLTPPPLRPSLPPAATVVHVEALVVRPGGREGGREGCESRVNGCSSP